MAKGLNEIVEDVVKERMSEIERDIDASIRYVNGEMYNEAVNMFRYFIDVFYSYETKSYRRHGKDNFNREPAGSGKGYNLYKAMDIRINRKHPKLEIYMPRDVYSYENDMSGGYQHNSPIDVAYFVTEGIRYPYAHGWDWDASYKGIYFDYSGKMADAFEKFNKDFDVISENIMRSEMRRRGYF